MKEPAFTGEEVGLRVVNAADDQVGRVTGVGDGALCVELDPGVVDAAKTKLGVTDGDEGDARRLEPDDIAEIDGGAVRLAHL